MTEFWEESFKDKKEMWGFEPADSAIKTLELFKNKGIIKVLIPGFGYGRNAKIFLDHGFCFNLKIRCSLWEWKRN